MLNSVLHFHLLAISALALLGLALLWMVKIRWRSPQPAPQLQLTAAELARMTAVVEASFDAIGTLNLQGHICQSNLAFRNLFGLAPDADLGQRTLTEYYPEWARASVTAGFAAAIADGKWQGETAILPLQGPEIPVFQVILCHRNAQAEPEFFSLILRDLTAMQRLETTLKQRIWDWESHLHAYTAELHQRTEQQQACMEVISRIRSSLDLETIFKLAATEVRQLLTADRVGVFRFVPDSGYNRGEFVAEAVLPAYSSALQAQIQDHCFGDRYALHYQNGRIQAVDDIQAGGLSECHIAVLARFQVRANLIVPLLQGRSLWGLLCIHQCDQPRAWQPIEIEFVTQIATQLGVALHQAELLQQAQQALQALKRTHTHLIQTEKMSGLGQLVAGVAHEINNPVNFIYGNLSHVSSYTQDLLALLALYQQHYPMPNDEIQAAAAAADLTFVAADLPKLLSSMQLGADRIRELVLSLRNFSRLDQAGVKPVDLHEGLDSTLLILQHRLKPTAARPGIEVEKRYGELPLVECYAGQMNQVFMNLLANAIDALQESEHLHANAVRSSGKITIQTQCLSANQVQITIQDNGAGIPVTLQTHLFEPFFTTKPAGKGTGLGLSISHQIVEKHGGRLGCVSSPETGTAFLIQMPVQQAIAVATV